MKPAPLEYLAASTAEEALAALERFAGNARLLAGGQSLVPLLSMRLLRPTAVVDINGIPGLDRIVAGDGVVRVGALPRYSALEASPVIRERVPLLAKAIPFVGHCQIVESEPARYRRGVPARGRPRHARASRARARATRDLVAVFRLRAPASVLATRPCVRPRESAGIPCGRLDCRKSILLPAPVSAP